MRYYTRDIEKRNIAIIANACFDGKPPKYADRASTGWLTWENVDDNLVFEIYKKTDLVCSINKNGRLIVPFYQFKNEKDKELRSKYDQYGNLMFLLDLLKSLDKKDLQKAMPGVIGLAVRNSSDEELEKVIEEIITKLA